MSCYLHVSCDIFRWIDSKNKTVRIATSDIVLYAMAHSIDEKIPQHYIFNKQWLLWFACHVLSNLIISSGYIFCDTNYPGWRLKNIEYKAKYHFVLFMKSMFDIDVQHIFVHTFWMKTIEAESLNETYRWVVYMNNRKFRYENGELLKYKFNMRKKYLATVFRVQMLKFFYNNAKWL